MRTAVESETRVAHEPSKSEICRTCEINSESRGCRNRRKHRHPRHDCLVYEFSRCTATHLQNVIVQGKKMLCERPSDDLVDGIVTPDILAHADEVAGASE